MTRKPLSSECSYNLFTIIIQKFLCKGLVISMSLRCSSDCSINASFWYFLCDAECYYAECHYAECRYAECRYVECRYVECWMSLCWMTLCWVLVCWTWLCMLSVVMLNVGMPIVLAPLKGNLRTLLRCWNLHWMARLIRLKTARFWKKMLKHYRDSKLF